MSTLLFAELWLDYLLALGILLLAWLTLNANKTFNSIVLFISLGLFVTLIWARLDAWDVAIAEAAIGAGLTGALLLATWHRTAIPRERDHVSND